MFTSRHIPLHWELVKWIAILTLAAALAGLLTRIAGGTVVTPPTLRPPPAPALLPPAIHDWSTPMPSEEPPTVAAPRIASPSLVAGDPTLRLWRLLDLQRGGHVEEAVAEWQTIPLPRASEVWRHVALAQAHLAGGQLKDAAAALETADLFEPNHAVVHYYRGLLRLEQSRHAREWYDAIEASTRFVAFTPADPADVGPNTKSMYRLAAKQELELTIELAPRLVTDQLLTPTGWPDCAAWEPTVGDLLEALGADRLAARAHNALSYICLDQGQFEDAEEHLDAAAAGGMCIVYGYRDLETNFAATGRYGDAARAALKGLGHGASFTTSVKHVLEHAGQALRDIW